jgi:hypothetical protein
MRLPSSKLGLIHLDETDCCALWHAFVHHPHMMQAWGQVFGQMALAAHIMHLSWSLSFEPEPEFMMVYRAFATAECERLAAVEVIAHEVRCRHEPSEHRGALEKLLRILPSPRLQ